MRAGGREHVTRQAGRQLEAAADVRPAVAPCVVVSEERAGWRFNRGSAAQSGGCRRRLERCVGSCSQAKCCARRGHDGEDVARNLQTAGVQALLCYAMGMHGDEICRGPAQSPSLSLSLLLCWAHRKLEPQVGIHAPHEVELGQRLVLEPLERKPSNLLAVTQGRADACSAPCAGS